jgi:hypothetical protein
MTFYVLDTSSLIVLKNYYRTTFPSLWTGIEQMVANGTLFSTREVLNELQAYNDADFVQNWATSHKTMFKTPTNTELEFVARIFQVPHFHALIGSRQLLKGTPVADPFVIAAAAVVIDGCVVTQEKPKLNAAKIPNVCEHFGIAYTDLEGFMTAQNWNF